MFCPKCGALMRPKDGALCCNHCGTEKSISKEDKKTVTSKSTKRELVVLDGNVSVLPTTTECECPKCAHHEAYWIIRQTRAADEPATRIYECTKWHAKWREYG